MFTGSVPGQSGEIPRALRRQIHFLPASVLFGCPPERREPIRHIVNGTHRTFTFSSQRIVLHTDICSEIVIFDRFRAHNSHLSKKQAHFKHSTAILSQGVFRNLIALEVSSFEGTCHKPTLFLLLRSFRLSLFLELWSWFPFVEY